LEITEVKKFLRVDFDEDDQYISLLMDAAKEYIIHAVGFYDETKALIKLIALTFISSLYEKRSYTVEEAGEKVSYILKSAILQLQLSED